LGKMNTYPFIAHEEVANSENEYFFQGKSNLSRQVRGKFGEAGAKWKSDAFTPKRRFLKL
jgi:hypothetical protein